MKRKLLGLVILALLLLVPLMVHAATAGKFTSVEGKVDVTSPGKEARPANLGDPLNVGDIIRTKSKAKCEVAFPDGSILRLAENSRLRVNEFAQEKGQRNATLDLFRGKIQNVVMAVTGAASEKSKYEIHTPTAVCGVRGTVLFVYHQAGVTGAAFGEGTGYGYSRNRPGDVRTIRAGQAMIVSNPNLPPQIRPATSMELNQHRRDTAPSEKPKSGAKRDEERRSERAGARTGEGQREEQKQGEPKGEESQPGAGAGAPSASAGAGEQSKPVDIVAQTMETPTSAALSLLPGATGPSQTGPFTPVETPPGPLTSDRGPIVVPVEPTPSGPTDLTPPEITIIPQASPVVDGKTDIKIALTATESANFSTKLDEGPAVAGATVDFTGLAAGSHTITVEAKDNAGNVKTRSLSFDLSRYALTGDFYGCIGGVYGTAAGQLAGVHGYNWGGWNIGMEGSGNTTPNETWTLSAGGGNAADGYWMSIAPGSTNFSARTLSGTSHLTFLSTTRLGSGTGTVTGTYDDGRYSLSDIGVGSYTEKPLGFFSSVSAGLTGGLSDTTTLHHGDYNYSGGGSYSYSYYETPQFQDGRYYLGSKNYERYGETPARYETAYYSDGTTATKNWTWNASSETWTKDPGTRSGVWDTAQPYATLLSTPEDPGGVSGEPYEYSAAAISYGSGLKGILGGSDPLWPATGQNPAGAVFLGTYDGSRNAPGQLWQAAIASNNPNDGGAFQGYLAGIDLPPAANPGPRSLEGLAAALYIDPAGNAGYWTGTLAGPAYPEIGMFLMKGGLVPHGMSGIGVTAAKLYDSIWSSSGSGNGGNLPQMVRFPTGDGSVFFTGNFGGNGFISQTGCEEYDVSPNRISTMSIVNYDTNAVSPWGIYQLTTAGTFGNPASGNVWAGRVGGSAAFGAYFDHDQTSFENDGGFWLATAEDGSWSGNRMGGTLSGRFLTGSKLGPIGGDLLGTYNDADGTWQNVSAGGWSGTPLAFGGMSLDSLWYNDGGYMSRAGRSIGLIGVTDAPWEGTKNALAMGMFQNSSENGSGGYLWNSMTMPPQFYSETGTDGQAFLAHSTGIWRDGAVDGYTVGIYKTADGKAGIILGPMTGRYYDDLGMWEADGSLTKTQMAAAANAYPDSSVTVAGVDFGMNYGTLRLSGAFSNGSSSQGTISGQGTMLTSFLYLSLLKADPDNPEQTIELPPLPLRWGAFNMLFNGETDGSVGTSGNTYSGKSPNWSAKVGGIGPTLLEQAPFFYLGDITDGTWDAAGNIRGTLAGAYQTLERRGTFAGPLFGLGADGETAGSGGWIGSSVGVYVAESKLNAFGGLWGDAFFEGSFVGDSLYAMDDSGFMTPAGAQTGLIAGVAKPWTASAKFQVMGMYEYTDAVAAKTHYLLNTPVSGYDRPADATASAPADSGYFKGFSAGIWRQTLEQRPVPDSTGAPLLDELDNPVTAPVPVAGSLSGAIRALSVTPETTDENGVRSRTLGILASDDVSGTLYPGVGMWTAQGNLKPDAAMTLTVTDTAEVPVTVSIVDASLSGNALLSGTFHTESGSNLIFGSGTLFTQFFTISGPDGTSSPPWGAYNLKLPASGDFAGAFFGKPATGGAWSAVVGGNGQFGYGGSSGYGKGYWLATVKGNWTAAGEITGTLGPIAGDADAFGRYVTPAQMGTIGGPFYGIETAEEGTSTWIGQSIGDYKGVATDFGGDWHHSTLYNDYGSLEVNSYGDDGNQGAFGFKKRPDGSYDFLAAGEYYDRGYGEEGFGGPYIWSGSLWNGDQTPNRYMEAFTGGIWKKAKPGDGYGTMAGYTAALYYTEDRKVGLILGDLTGGFYEMNYEGYPDEVKGMWRAESGVDGLIHIDKTASLPEDFDASAADVGDDHLHAYAAGTFGGNVGTIRGEYYNGSTKFITYAPDNEGDNSKSLPFGIYNLKLGHGSSHSYYTGKPADAAVSWSTKIGGDGDFGYKNSDFGYWLADISGTWDEYSPEAGHGTMNGAMGGKYVSMTHMGTIGGPFYGIYAEDGEIRGSGTWIGLSVGAYEGTPSDFGGDWYHSKIYNDSGHMAWDGDGGGENEGAFGFLKRPDGNYDFLAIGDFHDYGNGAAGHGGPYIWSGSLWYDGLTENRYMEAFTGGIWKKAKPGDGYGTMAGYTAALYYTEDGKAGLIRGGLTGTFYEMQNRDGQMYGMWTAESGVNGLIDIDKTASLPSDFNVSDAVIGHDSLYGNLAGGFAGNVGTIRGEYYNGSTKFITYAPDTDGFNSKSLPFGIYNLKLGEGPDYNYYQGKPAGAAVSWDAKIGGAGYFGHKANDSDYGFWMANLTGQWDEYGSEAGHGTITGAVSGQYLTTTQMGTIGGPFYGLYTENIEVSGAGTWSGLSVGAYEGAPLTFGGTVDGSFRYFDGNQLHYHYYTTIDGVDVEAITGLWGGTDDSWNGTPALALGRHLNTYGYPLFIADVDGSKPIGTGKTTSFVFAGGRVANNGIAADSIGFYARENGATSEVGFLTFGSTGRDLFSFPADGSGAWMLSDNVTAFKMGDIASPVIGSPYFMTGYFDGVGESPSYSAAIPNEYPGGDAISIVSGFVRGNSLISQDWGIWQMIAGGSHPYGIDSVIPGKVNTAWTIDSYVPATTGSPLIDSTLYQVTETVWDKTGKTIDGKAAMAFTSWADAKTYVGGGEIKGVFDPTSAKTWQAITTGAGIETAKFLAMANGATTTDAASAALKALNIPAVQVGKATLSQAAGTVNNLSGVTMADVTFFANSTGGTPRIWATDKVSGSFTAAPSVTGPVVPLSSGVGGLTADFGIRNWNTANGTWGANVTNGAGALSGGTYNGNVNFTGGAVGSINSTAKTISGTAAGIVKPAAR